MANLPSLNQQPWGTVRKEWSDGSQLPLALHSPIWNQCSRLAPRKNSVNPILCHFIVIAAAYTELNSVGIVKVEMHMDYPNGNA